MDEEEKRLSNLTKEINEWFKLPRFSTIHRPYTANQLAPLKPTIEHNYPSNEMSKKLWRILSLAQQNKSFHHTFGALDPIQVANLAKHLTTVYVSGWQCSSTASTTNEPGPDFADYPMNTVPNKVDQLFKALMFQDRKQNQARSNMSYQQKSMNKKVDYLTPIIADADSGFGGTSSIMKLTKLFIEAGAAGIHMEDQRAGTKKCGHMAGKVIVSCREHCHRLAAIRLMADIMGSELIIVARTDSLSARMIDNNIDPVDHPFIQGVYDPKNPQNLLTFPNAGIEAIKNKFEAGENRNRILKQWTEKCYEMSLEESLLYANKLGFSFYFDWESSRTIEGYYLVDGCVEYCAARARHFLKYADVIWMETPKPNSVVAKKFSDLVKKHHPTKFLAYNLSPSFNWSASELSDDQIKSYCSELGNMGYVWQFITLAGFHMNALISHKFIQDYKKRHMLAYVDKIQREEFKFNVDQLTHQKWSGAELIDKYMNLVNNESKTTSTSGDSTEHQFAVAPKL